MTTKGRDRLRLEIQTERGEVVKKSDEPLDGEKPISHR